MAELLGQQSPQSIIKSIQHIDVSVNMTASASGTITTTISEVDPAKTVALPSTMPLGLYAENACVMRCKVTGATTLTVEWENDTSNDPSAFTLHVTIVEYV